jgi:ankyrin repeat protein
LECVQVVLQAHPKLNVQDSNGSTSLNVGVLGNMYDITSLLLEKGENPDVMDRNQKNALFIALENENNKIVELILSY